MASGGKNIISSVSFILKGYDSYTYTFNNTDLKEIIFPNFEYPVVDGVTYKPIAMITLNSGNSKLFIRSFMLPASDNTLMHAKPDETLTDVVAHIDVLFAPENMILEA